MYGSRIQVSKSGQDPETAYPDLCKIFSDLTDVDARRFDSAGPIKLVVGSGSSDDLGR